jgi:hypothetical protein
VDTDCDGFTDDDALLADLDRDGQSPYLGDCLDTDISVGAGFAEKADDFIDQDCDGDDLWDVDGDGDPAPASGGSDCDDAREDTYKGAPELCDGRDNDCDGRVDEACVSEGDPGLVIWPDSRWITAGCNCGHLPNPRVPPLSPLLPILALVPVGVLRRRVRPLAGGSLLPRA